ncbi:uncharacterized protein N7473_000293 [Penicillium subrubescens]|uniref:Calcium influx-promoting protein ehs1 n=1 Tax=Penicillium subrubescens TaxID=1316194 RepID=A0A1Q5SP77_9EURO|nr:uncharacterized protein N7473_000293 [Penicillium subrubescens]KAJ5910990.1 hypothetical protein N7473_000293 [Penicillium subrubescens]OKO89685.1 Calcium influx-promoting protein ehs1 [Penicillium subrubescens]
MRQPHAALQYLLTATILGTLNPLLLGLAHASTSHAADIPHSTESSLIGGPIISDGAGFPIALDSFNGLELRDNVIGDGETAELDLVRRGYPSDAKSLGNNQFQNSMLDIGAIQWFFVTKEVVNGQQATTISTLPASLDSRSVKGNDDVKLELRKRQQVETLTKRDQTTVYLSLTTCRTPTSNSSSTVPGSFPQLQIYYSTDESLEKPGPGKDDSRQTMITAEGGYAIANITTDSDIFIGIVAPNSTTFSGNYEYQIAASIDAPFHSVHDDDSFLYFIDADVSAALLVTNNLTQSEPNSTNYQEWMKLNPPYTMFAHNINNTALAGLERSFCALDRLSTLGRISNSTEMGMTSRGLGNKPKEQFYITGLNRSSTYNGILAMVGNSTQSGNGIIGGGGSVWKAMNFSTKADDNCAVLFNLTFCSEVAYAVPANPHRKNVSELRTIYDTYASTYYANFNNSLQQVQCTTEPESMYSLAVDCTDCATAYKQWLCSVSIPRCEDFTSNAAYLQVRNAGQNFINGSSLPEDSVYRQSAVTNASRNPLIDSQIQPGPYKEILPCQDICYTLVKSCPSTFGFGCPKGEWLNASYGYRNGDGDITCSYLGAAYYLSGAGRGVVGVGWGIVIVVLAVGMLL